MLETDFPAGEEVHQDAEASQGDGTSLATSAGCAGTDGAMAAEGITAIPQTASSGISEQAAEHVGISASGILSSQLKPDMIITQKHLQRCFWGFLLNKLKTND